MSLPTTQTNAEALAASKGYTLATDPDGSLVAIGPDGLRYAAAVSWPAMLAWLIRAERLDGEDGAA